MVYPAKSHSAGNASPQFVYNSIMCVANIPDGGSKRRAVRSAWSDGDLTGSGKPNEFG